VDERTLEIAAGHIPDTAFPGQIGNVGVAAHRDTLFRNLKDVRHGDTITLATLDGEFVYRVVSFQIVQRTDVSVLDPSPEGNTLTLVTCYPFYLVGHAPQRFIVHAVQVL
jgi:sortase A